MGGDIDLLGKSDAQPSVDPEQPPITDSRARATLVVGRDTELSQLQECLEKASEGRTPTCLYQSGKLGLGKLLCCKPFSIASPRGTSAARIGLGQCIEQYGAGEAYLPVLEALGRVCRQETQLVEVLSQHAPSWLVQMPGLLETAQLEALQRRTLGVSQERTLREMAETLEVVSAQQPLILALEDLHWSDTATLELVSMLARRQERAHLLIVGTYRPGDARVRAQPLRKLQHELQLHSQCEELALPPLTQEAVGVYLAERFCDGTLLTQLASPLYQRTGGNPLFLVNTVDYLARQGLVVQAPGGWEIRETIQDITQEVPDTLQQMIERQIDNLQPLHQQLLEVASVAGATFSAAAVAAGMEAEVVAVETECDTLARQEQFIQAIGVEEWPDGAVSGQYGFRHALYQAVLMNRLGAARKVRAPSADWGTERDRLWGSGGNDCWRISRAF